MFHDFFVTKQAKIGFLPFSVVSCFMTSCNKTGEDWFFSFSSVRVIFDTTNGPITKRKKKKTPTVAKFSQHSHTVLLVPNKHNQPYSTSRSTVLQQMLERLLL
jgi:hypothetical protein